jgi:hypothetical protein
VYTQQPDAAQCILQGQALASIIARTSSPFEVCFRDTLGKVAMAEDLDVFDPARHRPKPKLPTYTAALAAADTAALAAASAAQLAARLSFACERVAERHSTFAALERSYRALGSDLRDLVKFVESVVSEGRLALRSMRMSSATLEQLQRVLPRPLEAGLLLQV